MPLQRTNNRSLFSFVQSIWRVWGWMEFLDFLEWFLWRPSYYLTRAISSPTSDLVKEVLGCLVCCVSCPGVVRPKPYPSSLSSWASLSYGTKIHFSSFLAEILWSVCQSQYVHKDTESDSCRLQVCSLSFSPAIAPWERARVASVFVCRSDLNFWESVNFLNGPKTIKFTFLEKSLQNIIFSQFP